MHWHIILTEKCNMRCRYCYGKSMDEENDLGERFDFDFSCPSISGVDVSRLADFLERDDEPVLIFYGGEPLLQTLKIKQMIDGLPSKVQYRMQTNGLLLDRLESRYLNRIGKMLVSIDGDEERTNYNRGENAYEQVISNIKKIRAKGYDGEIVARMTISFPDIYEQVMHLVGLIREGIFDSVHWQLDMGFYSMDFDKSKIERFVSEYNAGISKLVDWWVEEMKSGKVWKIYPLLGVFENLFNCKETKLMCGSGHAGYTITTDGKLVACPIMESMTDFYCGDLDSNPRELKKFDVGGLCDGCDYRSLCGGRCLYANKTELWPKEGQELICETVKHLIDSLKEKIPEVRKLVEAGTIGKRDFEYEKYFGPEIIP